MTLQKETESCFIYKKPSGLYIVSKRASSDLKYIFIGGQKLPGTNVYQLFTR